MASTVSIRDVVSESTERGAKKSAPLSAIIRRRYLLIALPLPGAVIITPDKRGGFWRSL
ncbi:MAG: hypothetical protein DDT24_00730 [Chloroflexi bacterium]|nr:hypothetical protein [Chloroflexota bacterium]